MRDRTEERVVRITVIYTAGLRVGGMVWDDPENAFVTQGADVHFDRVGDKGDVEARFESHERIKRFRLLAEPFSTENDTLTPTMKKRRRTILDRHAEAVERLYEESGASDTPGNITCG